MSGNFTWKEGADGTKYYVDSANGHVSGTVLSANNGPDFFKVGFGNEFVAIYDKEVNAKAAVEKMTAASIGTRNLKAIGNLQKPEAKQARKNRMPK
jgi:hypothetical protein